MRVPRSTIPSIRGMAFTGILLLLLVAGAFYAHVKAKRESLDEFYLRELACTGDNVGEVIDRWEDPGVPPIVGVEVPFSYLLGGGLFAGVLLLGVGIVLRRRAQ